MAQYNIDPKATVLIKEEPHTYRGHVSGHFQLVNVKTGDLYVCWRKDGSRGTPTDADFDEMLIKSEVKIVQPASRLTARLIAQMAEWDTKDALELEPEALKMMTQCVLLDDAGVKNGRKAIEAGLLTLWTADYVEKFGAHDSADTIRGWRRTRGSVGDRHVRYFVRMTGRVPRGLLKDGIVDDVLEIVIARARVEGGATLNSIRADLAAELNKVNANAHPDWPAGSAPYTTPSRSTIWRALVASEKENATSVADGKAMALQRWGGGGKPLAANRALELSIMDHTELPAMIVVDPEREIICGRPWITIHIDVHSRAVLAWVLRFRAPSGSTVGECIRRSSLPKRPPKILAERYPILRRICGKSAEIVVDNGAEFRATSLEDAAASAGFAIRFCPVKKPRYKAIGERFFRTLNERLAERLPGRMKPIAWTRMADYNPEKDAIVTMELLEALINQIVAEYHTEGHAGLNDMQPALVFEKSVNRHGLDIIGDVAGFHKELLEVEHGVQVDAGGVTRWNLRFYCARGVSNLLNDLAPLEPRRQKRLAASATTKIKYDPEDISVIHVWNRVTRKYVTLRCNHAAYADGMPLWLHEQIRADARAQAQAFNTEEEQMAARSRRIAALRALDKTALAAQKRKLAELLDVPRQRQIAENLVDQSFEAPSAVLGDFLSHDLARETALDTEIRAPREAIKGPKDKGHDRRSEVPVQSSVKAPVRRADRARFVGKAYK